MTSRWELGSHTMPANRFCPVPEWTVLGLAVWSLLGPSALPAEARVTRIVIDEKLSPAYGGKSFGTAGPYERITGRLFGGLDPQDTRNWSARDRFVVTVSWRCWVR